MKDTSSMGPTKQSINQSINPSINCNRFMILTCFFGKLKKSKYLSTPICMALCFFIASERRNIKNGIESKMK